ncbi:hypothetical protein [Psychromonas hadalis]|uniref:hypothetical protein n=1 Tax=Psychromonas hadalis TaxID=211669 RepID=UPI0003B5A76A|nr:hypothetical protein [Psychromonas hadalis]
MKKLLLTVSSIFLLTACANTPAPENAWVYISNGAIQCESDGKTGAETERLLTEKNIVVSKTECGHLSNVAVILMCGGPATNINVHQIKHTDLEKSQALGFQDVITLKQLDNLGYEASECQ